MHLHNKIYVRYIHEKVIYQSNILLIKVNTGYKTRYCIKHERKGKTKDKSKDNLKQIKHIYEIEEALLIH